MKNTLTKPIIQFLKDHNYKVETSPGSITIKKSFIDTWLIVGLALLICIPISIFVIELSPLFVVGIWILVIGAAIIQLRNNGSVAVLKIDQNNRLIKNGEQTLVAKDIKSIGFDSKYIASYTSAFKDTNEEHKISLVVTMKSGRKHHICSFKSDYSSPSTEMKQLKEFIDEEIGKMKMLFSPEYSLNV
ncbi:MAG: hypothetical protein AAFQ94_18440 [Bacteroidota bacterium]